MLQKGFDTRRIRPLNGNKEDIREWAHDTSSGSLDEFFYILMLFAKCVGWRISKGLTVCFFARFAM